MIPVVLAKREGVNMHTFADLKGITGGEWNLSEEEIDASFISNDAGI